MIYSMTGFGAAERQINGVICKAEVRSINSKGLDITLKIPPVLKPLEFTVRKMLQAVHRGKVDCTITIDGINTTGAYINKQLLQSYIQEIKLIAEQNQVAAEGLMNGILLIPGVIQEQQTPEDLLNESEIEFLITLALQSFNAYRLAEGEQLMTDLNVRITSIRKILDSILPYEGERIQKIRERITRELGSVAAELQADTSRLEMEMIYYIEKLDINEEKVRLIAHCDYFEKIMKDESESEKGKKLGFLAQEMGREVNTIGSKANHSYIQHQVVLMKEEIEKIKEQVNNIL
jgi:uncharacterized protein (TIGR00255 family)